MSITRVYVSIEAGHLTPTPTPPSQLLGQQFQMDGSPVLLYITPTIAKQWIETLTTITGEQ
jgi:hypothetical protein